MADCDGNACREDEPRDDGGHVVGLAADVDAAGGGEWRNTVRVSYL
jgi:hypothetical protein